MCSSTIKQNTFVTTATFAQTPKHYTHKHKRAIAPTVLHANACYTNTNTNTNTNTHKPEHYGCKSLGCKHPEWSLDPCPWFVSAHTIRKSCSRLPVPLARVMLILTQCFSRIAPEHVRDSFFRCTVFKQLGRCHFIRVQCFQRRRCSQMRCASNNPAAIILRLPSRTMPLPKSAASKFVSPNTACGVKVCIEQFLLLLLDKSSTTIDHN